MTYEEIQSTVTSSWLAEQMKLHGKQGSDFKEALGVTAQAISEILNETPGRPQRQSRVILYLYFTFCCA